MLSAEQLLLSFLFSFFSTVEHRNKNSLLCLLKAVYLTFGQAAKIFHEEAKMLRGEAYIWAILIVTSDPQDADQSLIWYAKASLEMVC